MALPVTPERRADATFNDEEIQQDIFQLQGSYPLNSYSSAWGSIDRATSAFKLSRTKRLKYLRTTTSDIRNHFTHLSFGWLDNYQLIIFIQSNTDRYFQKINAIINQPGFPVD